MARIGTGGRSAETEGAVASFGFASNQDASWRPILLAVLQGTPLSDWSRTIWLAPPRNSGNHEIHEIHEKNAATEDGAEGT